MFVPDDNLLVGTRQGHLFMYSLVKNDDKCEVQLMRYNKSFSKKAVQQLEVIPDYHLLVSLTGKCSTSVKHLQNCTGTVNKVTTL